MNIGEEILQKLKEQKRSVAWLAEQVNCDRSNLYRMLKNSPHIHSGLLFRISVALEVYFFDYYYPEYLKRIQEEQNLQ